MEFKLVQTFLPKKQVDSTVITMIYVIYSMGLSFSVQVLC
jgi:hypothetical protein